MIKSIARWKYWQIIVTGILASVTAVLLLAFTARWANYTWPGSHDGIQVTYLVVSAATAWIVTGIFIEAAFYKHRQKNIDDLMDRIAWGLTKEDDRG